MTRLNCPVCLNDIQADRVMNGVAYCSCGHVLNLSRRPVNSETNRVLPVILFSLFLIAVVTHAINWDTYFFTIIPLKMKQLAGIAKVEELKEIADICKKRKKSNCEVSALEEAFSLDKKELAGLLRAGEIYMQLKKFHAATQTYGLYFKHGGKSDSSRYAYAKALGEIGQFGEAKKQFHYILKTDRSNPQFQVARSYVELLMKNNDYAAAKSIIEEYRQAGPNSALFLEKEWKAIHQKLKRPSIKNSARGV